MINDINLVGEKWINWFFSQTGEKKTELFFLTLYLKCVAFAENRCKNYKGTAQEHD